MLLCCVCLSFVCDVCIVPKRCVLEQSYYWQPIGSHIWGIDWYQNEWPWPLFRGRIKVMSAIALHTTFIISETAIVAWFQRTTNRKWPMGYKVWCEAVRSAILAAAWLLIFILLLFLMCHYAVYWCDKLRLPFPIGGSFEPSLCLYRFL